MEATTNQPTDKPAVLPFDVPANVTKEQVQDVIIDAIKLRNDLRALENSLEKMFGKPLVLRA